jgi:signal transduction histidine kinase
MVDLSGAQVRLGGQVTRLLTLRDLTAMERDAAELRSARETAEAAAQAKGRFLAVMSHELRTPMSGIIGMIDMLGETRMDLEQAKFLSVLRNSSHALLTVLNDVLDYSKLEAGRVELEQVDFDLDGLVSSVMAVHRATALQRNTTLTVDWSSEPIRALRGDPTRLAQVLHNLVGNAVKFTSNGTVTLKMQTLPASNGQLTLAAQVRDTGVGMAPEMLESLFRPI